MGRGLRRLNFKEKHKSQKKPKESVGAPPFLPKKDATWHPKEVLKSQKLKKNTQPNSFIFRHPIFIDCYSDFYCFFLNLCSDFHTQNKVNNQHIVYLIPRTKSIVFLKFRHTLNMSKSSKNTGGSFKNRVCVNIKSSCTRT